MQTFTICNPTYRMNPVSAADELWMKQEFGDRLEKIFQEIDMKEICRIVFRLLKEEDKKDFAAKDVEFMNEQGETNTVRVGGVFLLYAQVSGYHEKVEIFKALLETIGISRPMQKKIGLEGKDEKKNTAIGLKPLTSSHPNMGGRQMKSSPGQQKKYRTASKLLKKGHA